jgi:hypothetical protein
MFTSGGLGIDLGRDGVTLNDSAGHTASGANYFQNFPVLTSAFTNGTTTTITGTFSEAAEPNTVIALDFYANAVPNSSGYGQGQTYLGSTSVTTDGSGNASFTVTLPFAVARGQFVAATATDPAGNTSEFSADITVKLPLTVNTNSSIMLVGNNPPPLTGYVNGTPFTGSISYTTPYGDQVTVTLGTTATAGSPVGQYAITATLSGVDGSNYVIDPVTSHIGTMYVVSLGADPSSTTGAESVVFWDNKGNKALVTAADLASLDTLNLVSNNGNSFDPKAVAQLQAWLSVSPNATTSYQVAVQLAVMDLNVLAGYVQATDLVYAGALLQYATTYGITGLTSGGFIDVQNLMNAANAILGIDPRAVTGDPNQAYEAALTQVLQEANANSDFVTQELLLGLVGTFV